MDRSECIELGNPVQGEGRPPTPFRAWSVPWISKTHARQNETLRIFKIRTGEVCSRCGGQFRGNLLGGFGLCHTYAVALYKILPIYALHLATVLPINYTPPLNPSPLW